MYMLLHPCEGYFLCRGVITNLFLVEAILVTCARGQSGKMDAPASLFSLEFSLLTRNKTAQKARARWRDTAKKVRNKNYCQCVLGASSTGVMAVQPLAICVAVNKLDALSGNAVNISTYTADLTSTQCTRCKKCENL